MLQNEVYIGHMVQGRYGSVSYKTKRNMPKPTELWFRVENTHEAIIDEKQWQTVQRLISENRVPSPAIRQALLPAGFTAPAAAVPCAPQGATAKATFDAAAAIYQRRPVPVVLYP